LVSSENSFPNSPNALEARGATVARVDPRGGAGGEGQGDEYEGQGEPVVDAGLDVEQFGSRSGTSVQPTIAEAKTGSVDRIAPISSEVVSPARRGSGWRW
jgi:hypothetical protein